MIFKWKESIIFKTELHILLNGGGNGKSFFACSLHEIKVTHIVICNKDVFPFLYWHMLKFLSKVINQEKKYQKHQTEYYQTTPKRRRRQKEGKCLKGSCQHPTARQMVQCQSCLEWLHCICVGVDYWEVQKIDYNCEQCASK